MSEILLTDAGLQKLAAGETVRTLTPGGYVDIVPPSGVVTELGLRQLAAKPCDA